MNIPLPTLNEKLLMQRAGYHAFIDPNTGSESYVMRLGRNFYPRFHVYLQTKEETRLLSLHLDMKKPSYEGGHAHSGEYDGAQVEQEVERLQRWIQYFASL